LGIYPGCTPTFLSSTACDPRQVKGPHSDLCSRNVLERCDSSSPSRCGPTSLCVIGRTRDLPVPEQRASAHARVSDHAGPSGHSRSRARPCCFRDLKRAGTRDSTSFAAQWLACALPCRRFAVTLAGANARLEAEVVSLRLPRVGLAPPTPCRSPGALRLSPSYYTISVLDVRDPKNPRPACRARPTPERSISRPMTTLPPTRKGTLAHLRPPTEAVERQAELAFSGWVLFPTHADNADTRLLPLRKGAGLQHLDENSFRRCRFLRCRRRRD
jgi:hypothetical protein